MDFVMMSYVCLLCSLYSVFQKNLEQNQKESCFFFVRVELLSFFFSRDSLTLV